MKNRLEVFGSALYISVCLFAIAYVIWQLFCR